MTLYYEGRNARITHNVFEANAPTRQSFAIPELRYVHQLRSTTADAAIGSPSAVFGSGTIVATAGIVGILGSTVLHSLFTTVAAVLVLIPASVLHVQSWKVRSRPNALWAVYRGERVCLFETRDKLVFEQVRRALLRALESSQRIPDPEPSPAGAAPPDPVRPSPNSFFASWPPGPRGDSLCAGVLQLAQGSGSSGHGECALRQIAV